MGLEERSFCGFFGGGYPFMEFRGGGGVAYP